jgi:protein-tyrosine kinase
MRMSGDSGHLVERVAGRLRGVGGLTAPEVAPERDIRRVVREDAPRNPLARRPARPPFDHDSAGHDESDHEPAGHDESDHDSAGHDSTGHALGDHEAAGTGAAELANVFADEAIEADAPPRGRKGREAAEDHRPAGDRAVVDPTRRSTPVPADGSTSLAVPEALRQPPLDMAALEKAGLVVGHKVRTRISEEFRITVGHILRSMHANYAPGRGAPNVIMVTSARPGEGKSFSSLNLAGSIAQHAQREIVLVDVDAKHRSISAELGLADRPGLLDLSTNSALRIEDVVVRTAIPHLSIITIGSGHTVGTEISPNRPVTALVERIARRFPNAVVLLDAPPCLSTSDPSTLAPFVGQIVMVVEAERTQRNEVIAALDLIKACPSVTLMLNKIKLTTSYTFGAYHYFGTYS